MNCHEAQGLITEYVNDRLDIKQLEEFVLHIESCAECREELEVYYIVFTGIKRLDLDDNIAINYHDAFLNSIAISKNRIKWQKIHYLRRRCSYAFLVLIVLVWSSIQVSEMESVPDALYVRTTANESELRYYNYDESKTSILKFVKSHIPAYKDITDLDEVKELQKKQYYSYKIPGKKRIETITKEIKQP